MTVDEIRSIPPALRETPLHSAIEAKTYIRIPKSQILGPFRRLVRALIGGVLSPIYWLLAYHYRVPGLSLRLDCISLAFRLLLSGPKAYVSYENVYRLVFWPIDSTRYFEFAFMRDALSDISAARCLDVSSPRIFPITLILKQPGIFVELMNPDAADLADTRNYVKALRLESRCNLHSSLISSAPFEPESFDVVTSISVLEHIPEDRAAIQKMWELLKPGGRLLLTLPCAARASEQYSDRNEYGLLSHCEDGYFFFQRLYDDRLLEERIFSITGPPQQYAIYGEKCPGTLRRTLDRKIRDPHYPHWREPHMMGQNFRYFKELGELPGEGVVALGFTK